MKTLHLTTKYLDDEVFMEFGRYHDGSIAIRLVTELGEPASVVTVCMSDSGFKPEDGNVFIKDWSENEGMLEALQKEKIVGEKLRELPAGFSTAYECKLLIDPETDDRVRLLP
jgi:hypothetical protein